jgi:hypothetical protein
VLPGITAGTAALFVYDAESVKSGTSFRDEVRCLKLDRLGPARTIDHRRDRVGDELRRDPRRG